MANDEEKSINKILNNVEFGKFPYDKNYKVKIEAGRQQGKSFKAGIEFSNKIWKDKIKAKIEELNKDFKEYENGQEWEIQDEIRGQIDVLQSLLEKE